MTTINRESQGRTISRFTAPRLFFLMRYRQVHTYGLMGQALLYVIHVNYSTNEGPASGLVSTLLDLMFATLLNMTRSECFYGSTPCVTALPRTV